MKREALKEYVRDEKGLRAKIRELEGFVKKNMKKEDEFYAESAVIFLFGLTYEYFNFDSTPKFLSQRKLDSSRLDAEVKLNGEKIYLEFERYSREFLNHGHLDTLQKTKEEVPCRLLVVKHTQNLS